MSPLPHLPSGLGLVPMGVKEIQRFRAKDEVRGLFSLVEKDLQAADLLPYGTAPEISKRVKALLQQPTIAALVEALLKRGDPDLLAPLRAEYERLVAPPPGVASAALAELIVESVHERLSEAKKSDRAAARFDAKRLREQAERNTERIEREIRSLREPELERLGLRVWGSGAEADETASNGGGREERAPYKPLMRAVRAWLRAPPRKRDQPALEVFWLSGPPTANRRAAHEACLHQASLEDRTIVEAGSDLSALGSVIAARMKGPSESPAALFGLDLDDEVAAREWRDFANRIRLARPRTARPETEAQRIAVAGSMRQARTAASALEKLAYIWLVDGQGQRQSRLRAHPGPRRATPRVLNQGMPMTAKHLYGREPQSEQIMQAWLSEQTRVLSIVAFGGSGKSALANRWLHQMKRRKYMDAERVLAWSFYSQGTRDNLVSADEFVNRALTWLGHKRPITLSAAARGHALAKAIKRHKFLLVLDGLEPLQYPSKEREVGRALTDESMSTLLSELAQDDWRGLCLITTRLAVKDLERYRDRASPTVETIDLKGLPEDRAAELLESLIGRPAPRERLEGIAKQVGCNALALTLLGHYIRDVSGGNIEGVRDLDRIAVDAEEGGHARRIMSSYERFLKRRRRPAELAILRLVGLFDRPAPPDAIRALLRAKGLSHLTSSLDDVGSELWTESAEALRSMGLLNAPMPGLVGVIDAHPLVREHFRDQLRARRDNVWSRANATLFEYFSSRAEDLPDTVPAMQPLYAAVTHGCAAGLHQQVFDQILLPRIWRGSRTNYSTRQLGLTGADIVALSNYFEKHDWVTLAPISLTPSAEILTRTNAGVRLRQLGRLTNARECFTALLEAIDRGAIVDAPLEDASYAAAQSCELLVIAGRLRRKGANVDTALMVGERAVEYADRGKEAYFPMHARSSLAEVYFMLGDPGRTEELFNDAMEIDRARKPEPRFMYSQSLFRYAYHLIESGNADEILAMETRRRWGSNGSNSSLLSKAIKHLVKGAARRALIERDGPDPGLLREAERLLDRAVLELRTAGYPDYVVRGLLERSRFRRVRHRPEDRDLAHNDLDRALEFIGNGAMGLLGVDLQLERVACELAFWQEMTLAQRAEAARTIAPSLRRAARGVTAMHYRRRAGELAQLKLAAADRGIAIA